MQVQCASFVLPLEVDQVQFWIQTSLESAPDCTCVLWTLCQTLVQVITCITIDCATMHILLHISMQERTVVVQVFTRRVHFASVTKIVWLIKATR